MAFLLLLVMLTACAASPEDLSGKMFVFPEATSTANVRLTTSAHRFSADQDNHGGGFDSKQSFVGMMSEVHMWNYVLSPCEIMRYVDDLNFTPGNLINWRALEYNSIGRVLIENKQTPSGMPTTC
ncbi:serum amyloid P-component-like [Lycodopsis pacificus]